MVVHGTAIKQDYWGFYNVTARNEWSTTQKCPASSDPVIQEVVIYEGLTR